MYFFYSIFSTVQVICTCVHFIHECTEFSRAKRLHDCNDCRELKDTYHTVPFSTNVIRMFKHTWVRIYFERPWCCGAHSSPLFCLFQSSENMITQYGTLPYIELLYGTPWLSKNKKENILLDSHLFVWIHLRTLCTHGCFYLYVRTYVWQISECFWKGFVFQHFDYHLIMQSTVCTLRYQQILNGKSWQIKRRTQLQHGILSHWYYIYETYVRMYCKQY